MTVTITHAQCNALYDQILDRLSGIEDIWLAASTGKYEIADRLGREYSDELRLVLDDLGWGDGPGVETLELSTALDVLRRVFGRLRETVAVERADRQAGWIEKPPVGGAQPAGRRGLPVGAGGTSRGGAGMRVAMVPRLLPGHPRPADCDDPLLAPLGSGEEINRAVLSGLIAAAPARETSRGGDPITVLSLSFDAPEERARQSSTCCEVEVPDSIADRHRRWLRAGRPVWVAGQLTGDGLWATSIGTWRPTSAVIE